jgi:antibiotic biosynthesis monooxygenase (ABM) superfamily enzyme
MPWLKRQWSPHEADEWTKEDWIAIVLSSLSFILIAFGLAMSFFMLWSGVIMFVAGVIVTAVMFWVIDPKLDVISEDYEHRQRQYLEELERIQRWEGPK